MTKEQLAASLSGVQYRDEMNAEWSKYAKDAGLIVVFGASDDLMEFRGACNDEVGAWEGATAVLYKVTNSIEVITADSESIREIEDDFKLWKALGAFMERKNLIEAVWSPKDLDAAWLIKTDLPHATFDVMEEDELYCRGVVLSVADLV